MPVELALLILLLVFLPATLGRPRVNSSPDYLQNKSPSPDAVAAPGTGGQSGRVLPRGGGPGGGACTSEVLLQGSRCPITAVSITEHTAFAFTLFPNVFPS